MGLSDHSDRPEFGKQLPMRLQGSGVASRLVLNLSPANATFKPRPRKVLEFLEFFFRRHRSNGIKTSTQIDRNIEYWTFMTKCNTLPAKIAKRG